MSHPNRGTIARQAAKVGMTKQAFLADLCKRHEKIEPMAMELGITTMAISKALASAGIKRKHSRNFDYCGVVDCLTNHCAAMALSRGVCFGVGTSSASQRIRRWIWPC